MTLKMSKTETLEINWKKENETNLHFRCISFKCNCRVQNSFRVVCMTFNFQHKTSVRVYNVSDGCVTSINANLFVNVIHTSFTVLKYSHVLTKLPSWCFHSLSWKH